MGGLIDGGNVTKRADMTETALESLNFDQLGQHLAWPFVMQLMMTPGGPDNLNAPQKELFLRMAAAGRRAFLREFLSPLSEGARGALPTAAPVQTDAPPPMKFKLEDGRLVTENVEAAKGPDVADATGEPMSIPTAWRKVEPPENATVPLQRSKDIPPRRETQEPPTTV